jgi:hypothetical protein
MITWHHRPISLLSLVGACLVAAPAEAVGQAASAFDRLDDLAVAAMAARGDTATLRAWLDTDPDLDVVGTTDELSSEPVTAEQFALLFRALGDGSDPQWTREGSVLPGGQIIWRNMPFEYATAALNLDGPGFDLDWLKSQSGDMVVRVSPSEVWSRSAGGDGLVVQTGALSYEFSHMDMLVEWPGPKCAAAVHYEHGCGFVGVSMCQGEGVVPPAASLPVSLRLLDLHELNPLFAAIEHSRLDVCRLLIGAGASVAPMGAGQRTALHVAAIEGQIEIGELLMASGADVEARDEAGWTPARSAIHADQPRFLEWIIGKGANKKGLRAAAKEEGRQNCVHVLR